MIRFLFGLFTIGHFGILSAQPTVPLVKEGASWIIREDAFLSTFPIVNQYYFQGDTNLLGKDYKKLYSTGVDSPLNASFGRLEALMREDSLGRVYAVYANPNYFWGCHQADSIEEFLYFDFGMSPGDTIYVPDSRQVIDSLYYTLDHIDTMLISGLPRRVWNMKRALPFGDDVWIEGIGSIYGLYFTYCEQFEIAWNLTCYFDNQVLYRTDTSRSCKYLLIKETVNRAFTIYPNPTSGVFNIDLSDYHGELTIEVYNSFGQRLFEKMQFSSYFLEIDLDEPPGIYFVTLTNNGVKETIKVMKK
ncbi:MAG: T9SS type A sorting domain-containing protein [Vicingaceae bacterium]